MTRASFLAILALAASSVVRPSGSSLSSRERLDGDSVAEGDEGSKAGDIVNG